jgi:hypothetical protein
MLVSELNRKHEEWTRLAPFWREIEILARGGRDVVANAAMFLRARPMEPASTYQARLRAASYENIFGTAIGWYASRLFSEPPQVFLRANGKPVEDDGVAAFLRNADRAGCSLVGVAQTRWFNSVVANGSVFVLLDLPRVDTSLLASQRHQRESGALDPYLVTYEPQQIINWSCDEHGVLEWAIVATISTRRGKLAAPIVIDRWYVYDRENVEIWESTRKTDTKAGDDDTKREAQLVHFGRHALADEGRVPLRKIEVPDELWFGWRVYPQIVDHLNADNAYAWLLMMSCLPVPVITGTYNADPKISETAYISLDTGSTFSYTEPTGVAFEWAEKRVRSLKEEIHRQMYLLSQARSTDATPAAQSGASKQADMQPSSEVLDGFGAIFRRAIRDILTDVLAIRGRADVEVDVQGLNFETDELGEIETAQAALDLGVPSDTFRGHVYKAVARCVAKADPETQKKIDGEIDAAPTEAERQQQALLQQASALANDAPPRPQA